MNRRTLLKSATVAIAGSALIPFTTTAGNKNNNDALSPQPALGKRKLGSTLEVSAIGLGVQN